MMPSDNPKQGMRARGGCLCGAVRFEVAAGLRDVVLCHCTMCRRIHGHLGAYAATTKDSLRLVESRGLKWYRSSPEARRGFCSECGGILFWERADRDSISITAGSLDPPTGLATALQIHVDSAGDYYEVDPRIPRRQD